MRRLKKVRLCIGLLVVLPGLALGCASPTKTQANLGESFTLAAGESATISSENLSVRFVELISDSRCPTGAVCIWEGEASCMLEITYSGITNDKILVQPGFPGVSHTDFGAYTIAFQVTPYPEVGKEIKKQDYRLEMTFSR